MRNRTLPIFLEIHVVCRLSLEGINWTKIKHICSWVLEVCWAKCLLINPYLNLSLNPGFLTPEVTVWIQNSRFIFSYLFEVIFIFATILHLGGSPQACWTGTMRDAIHCTEMHQSLCLWSRLPAAEHSTAEWIYTRSESDHAPPFSPPLGLLCRYPFSL